MVAPTVVFDLDGTLVDSAPDLAATLNIIFAREGLPPVPYYTARKLVGGGARSMIERSLAAQGRKLDTPAVVVLASVQGLVLVSEGSPVVTVMLPVGNSLVPAAAVSVTVTVATVA